MRFAAVGAKLIFIILTRKTWKDHKKLDKLLSMERMTTGRISMQQRGHLTGISAFDSSRRISDYRSGSEGDEGGAFDDNNLDNKRSTYPVSDLELPRDSEMTSYSMGITVP